MSASFGVGAGFGLRDALDQYQGIGKADFLMKSPCDESFAILFGNNAELLAALQSSSQRRKYRKGETILNHLDETTDVHYVLRGQAKAYMLSVDGREVWLNEFNPGTLFGEMAALCGAPRVCSIAAFTAVETAVFRGSRFVELMRSHSELGIIVSGLLATRLHRTSQRLYMASVESVEVRVYLELFERSAPCAHGQGFSRVIRPAPVIADIARKVGAARESVSRIITALVAQENIRRAPDAWYLTDPDHLLPFLP